MDIVCVGIGSALFLAGFFVQERPPEGMKLRMLRASLFFCAGAACTVGGLVMLHSIK